MIGFIAVSILGLIIAGLGINPLFPIAGYLVLLFFVPLASGSSQAVFQTKVAPLVQGRVFSVRSMLSRSMMPLADRIFEPLMRQGVPLASTVLASTLGLGPGRGIGLLFVVCSLTALVVSLLAYLNPRIRNLEVELPDAIPD